MTGLSVTSPVGHFPAVSRAQLPQDFAIAGALVSTPGAERCRRGLRAVQPLPARSGESSLRPVDLTLRSEALA